MNTSISTTNELSADLVFVGIDVAKDTLAVFVDADQRQLELTNQEKDLRRLVKELKKYQVHLILLEATGGYETALVLALAEAGLPFYIVYPKRVRQFARALGQAAKTDAIDARMLAYYARVVQPVPKSMPDEELRQLQALTTRRTQLIAMHTAEANRLETGHRALHRQIKDHLRWLERQIKEIDTDLHRRIKESDLWSAADERLQSVPGVGQILSLTLLTELPELGRLSHKQIASLVGVAPYSRESGKCYGKRFCSGGRNSVRRVLYMATIAASRFNPMIKEFYKRLCEKGKPKKVALIACARKLLIILNALIRDQSSWNPQISVIRT